MHADERTDRKTLNIRPDNRTRQQAKKLTKLFHIVHHRMKSPKAVAIRNSLFVLVAQYPQGFPTFHLKIPGCS